MSNKLIILDLDGTLLNTIGDLAACCNYMLEQRNLPTHNYEEYCTFVGNGVTRLVERALPESLRTAEYIAVARKDFVAHYTENIKTHTVPYSGINELLTKFTEQRAMLAVASNKFHDGTVQLVNHFFGDIPFKAIFGNREGYPLKPDKAIVELIMEQCGATAENTYMVGDSGVDMQTAVAAGVHAVGVSWGFRSREELEQCGAEFIADSAEQLYDHIYRN